MKRKVVNFLLFCDAEERIMSSTAEKLLVSSTANKMLANYIGDWIEVSTFGNEFSGNL